jgi:alpha-beta hydrolase superfamily lysophospholipase
VTTTSTQHEWTAPDGEKFAYSAWGANLKTGQNPRAIVLAVHGLSGAALDFEPLGAHMAQHGVLTFAPELRGQGNDPVVARRGDLERPEQWYEDLSAFFARVRESHPGVSIYYYGESLGAALLTRFVARARPEEQPAGLVLASPVVFVPGNPGWWQQFVFHFFLLVSPTRRIDVGKYTKRRGEDNPAEWVTRDAAHREWIKTAPHRITSFTFRFFKCVFEIIGGCLEAAPKITVPLLLVYAANDVYIKPAMTEKFFGQLGSREKELTLFPESYHLLLHDYDKADALARIETWLLHRIDGTGSAAGL